MIFITDNPELYDSILGIYGYMMQNEETINGLSAISRDTCETYITDAQWEEGWKKIATGAINPLKDLLGEEAYNKALAISTTTADVVCLAGAVKNTVKGIRDAKAAKGMPEEVPTDVPKIEEPNLAEIEKQADQEGEFYEDIFESQRADIPEYEDYLSDFAEAQNDYVKPAGGKSGTTTKPNQVHHFASNKSKKYTSQFESITKKYGLDLDGDWNKQSMPHQGRHPYAYHDYVLDNMQKFDRIANGDKTKFLKLYDQMKQKIINNPEMLYKEIIEGEDE